MVEDFNVEITRRESIKPYSPTPQHLGTVKLSMLDQISPDMYVPMILFYPFITAFKHSHTQQNPIEKASERLQRLRETLSKALALYYPFAGRLRNNLFVECNDEGAEFVEAKAQVSMSTILENPDQVSLTKFITAQPESGQEAHGGSLLFVQATIFVCGGISIGLSFSHKLADSCTVGEFVRTWSKITYENNLEPNSLTKPGFGQTCELFPPIIIPESLPSEKPSIELAREKCSTRRYVFTAKKIAALKRVLGNNPTRVLAVSSLLWKCAMKACASKSNEPEFSSSALWMAMNMRKRIVPPFGDNIAGNLLSGVTVKTDPRDKEVDGLQGLMGKLRKGMDEAAKSYSEKGNVLRTVQRQLEETQSAMMSDDTEFCICTSWCRFGFYEADFGWEKPTWVSVVASSEFKNSILLMDTKDGDGIEAWLVFAEENMALIETDKELLSFASLNPSVV